MSIGSLINKNTYLGNASTGIYNYNFKIFKDTDLKVIIKDPALIESELSDSAYSVTGVKNRNGGTIVLVGPASYLDLNGFLLSGFQIVIKRQLDLVQETDIRNQGDFFPEVHEDVFDRNIMVAQQQQEQLDRSLKLPQSTQGFNPELPTNLEGASGVSIVTNPAGDGFVVGPTADQIAGAQGAAVAADNSAIDSAASAAASASSATASQLSADQSAALATAAANTLASASGRTIVFLTFADSPVSPVQMDNGSLFVCDTGGGPIVINLPTIASLTLPYNLSFKLEAGLNPIVINRSSTDTIGGMTSKNIASIGSGTFLFADDTMTPDNWTDINFGVSSGNYTVQRFSGNGILTTFPLMVTPSVEENIDVYINGIYQQKNTFMISGMDLIMSDPVEMGTENLEVKIGTTLGIGVPSDNTVSTTSLINGAVTTSKLADGSVTTPKLFDGSVTTPKLADASVVTSKLADGSVTAEKLAAGALNIPDGSITGNKLAAGTVTRDKIDFQNGFTITNSFSGLVNIGSQVVAFPLTNSLSVSGPGLSKVFVNFTQGVIQSSTPVQIVARIRRNGVYVHQQLMFTVGLGLGQYELNQIQFYDFVSAGNNTYYVDFFKIPQGSGQGNTSFVDGRLRAFVI